MSPDQLRSYLDALDTARPWLRELKLQEIERGHANFVRMAEAGITLDLLSDMADQLAEHLPYCSDADMALNNLERYVAQLRSPLSTAALFQRDPAALGILIQLFSTSQYFSDLLIADPEHFEQLRVSHGRPVAPVKLRGDLESEVGALSDRLAIANTLRRFIQRETLRIGYGDIVARQKLEIVTSQLSHLASAVVDAGLSVVRQQLEEKMGTPRGPDKKPARFVVLALGKLGGWELNYSSDIDLVFLYDHPGQTGPSRRTTNAEFFARLVTDLVKLLTEHTERGQAYRVDLRLRPEGARGPLASSLPQALSYYDTLGRTWERQALIKASPIAGDLELGREFLKQIEPWVYRRYLNVAEIGEIKALKRRIENRARDRGEELVDVKTGHGGIRDVEFTIQFLQLLNGGYLPEVRTENTLQALEELERAGCLTGDERYLLDDNYRFLRKIEHRLQTMFDLQTHRMPSEVAEVHKLAIRMGYQSTADRSAVERFREDYRQKTAMNHRILDHLLHDAFADDSAVRPGAEVDLVFDPDPSDETIENVLSRYPFKDVKAAYRNLQQLSEESVPFLSAPRCRHFLASIAPRLLETVATTPDPDLALANLEKVSASLGGKGVLWELFSFSPPTLRLYVDLCASSQFLSEILVTHPGMIDELMDSLVLNNPRTLDELRRELTDLCRGAEDPEPILQSFKNKELLRIGVRDILGKDDLRATTQALSDLAETLLEAVCRMEYAVLVEKLGTPTIAEGARHGQPSRPVVLALGKFGGRELSYHSDLDVVFLYEADGNTLSERARGAGTSNFDFFSQWAQRVIKAMSRLGPHGRLYEVDARLRPTGRSGSLAIPLDEFQRYYAEGSAQLWERQALTKARVVFSEGELAPVVAKITEDAAYAERWRPAMADEIRSMRERLEAGTSEGNLKRGAGGIVDIEFLVQMLLLKHGPVCPGVRATGTLDALSRLATEAFLAPERHQSLRDSYRFLRMVESRLRLAYDVTRDDLPTEKEELEKLALLLGYSSSKDRTADQAFLDDLATHTQRIRQTFLSLLAEQSNPDHASGQHA